MEYDNEEGCTVYYVSSLDATNALVMFVTGTVIIDCSTGELPSSVTCVAECTIHPALTEIINIHITLTSLNVTIANWHFLSEVLWPTIEGHI